MLPAVLCAVLPCGAAWTLQTEEGGNVLFPAGDAKFQPMQRRADDSFKRYVANVEADLSDALRPRIRWTFPRRVEGEKNVVVLTLDAERWSGGQCVSDAKTVPIPKLHEKGKNIHIAGHEARTFCFRDELGRSFSLDFGEKVRLHAMDGREWNMGEFEGTYTHSVSSRNLKKDEVIALVPPGNENIHMEITGYPNYTSVIVDETEAEPNMKYNCFIAGDNPITIITNDSLPDAPDCLVIKDSYGNPFTVYLSLHYHKVYVLDYRKNFTPVSTVAEQYGVQDVILAQSIGVSQTRQAQSLLDNLMK